MLRKTLPKCPHGRKTTATSPSMQTLHNRASLSWRFSSSSDRFFSISDDSMDRCIASDGDIVSVAAADVVAVCVVDIVVDEGTSKLVSRIFSGTKLVLGVEVVFRLN